LFSALDKVDFRGVLVKDSAILSSLLLLFAVLLGHHDAEMLLSPDNSIPANPSMTPAHIEPE
jgi:quinol-cytochrome oxidoreductase complex cytochrome b subunit